MIKPRTILFAILCIGAFYLYGCSTLQVNRQYRNNALAKKLYIADSSNVIYKIDLKETQRGYEQKMRDFDAENKAKSTISGFIADSETPYQFILSKRNINDDDYKQSVIDLMAAIKKAGINNVNVPDALKKLIIFPDTRYTIVINHYGFYRTSENLAATAATSIAIGIFTLGHLIVSPIAAKSFCEYCVIDTRAMRVVLYNTSVIEDDPTAGKVLIKHLSRLLDDMLSVGK